jgi:hypothetical protein
VAASQSAPEPDTRRECSKSPIDMSIHPQDDAEIARESASAKLTS